MVLMIKVTSEILQSFMDYSAGNRTTKFLETPIWCLQQGKGEVGSGRSEVQPH